MRITLESLLTNRKDRRIVSSMEAKDIKVIRLSTGLTQEEFARRIKCTGRTVANLENGRTRASKAVVKRILRQKR